MTPEKGTVCVSACGGGGGVCGCVCDFFYNEEGDASQTCLTSLSKASEPPFHPHFLMGPQCHLHLT